MKTSSKLTIGPPAKGNMVKLYNNYEQVNHEVIGFTVVPYNIPQGCVATYFPEANPLVPLHLQARISQTPSSKSVKVKIEKMT